MAKVKTGKIEVHAETLEVADRLHSAAIHLLRKVRKQDSASGVGPARLSALSVLVFGGPKTLGDLAAAEQVTPPTMSRVVAGLRGSRLIEIKRDPHDARRMSIRPSPKGVRIIKEGRQRRIEYLAARLGGVTSRELAQLLAATSILDKLLHNWK